MSLLRLPSRHLSSLRRVTRPSTTLPTISTQQHRHYASDSTRADATSADNASDKTSSTAQPKILNKSPPKEEQASSEVKQHNDEMAQRADKPSMKATEKDVENDKVGKGFWGGEEAEGKKGGRGTTGGST